MVANVLIKCLAGLFVWWRILHLLGVNVEEVRGQEEKVMLQDAKKLRNDPALSPLMSNNGASPLHVAAAKNYITVLK